MKGILFFTGNLALLVAILFFSACSGKSNNNKEVIKALQESIESSNASINANSSDILHSLDEKSRDYTTQERAGKWLPKAQRIQKISEEIFSHIEGLKKSNEVNTETANELFARVMKYEEDIFATDSLIKYEFAKNIILISKSFDNTEQTGDDFYKTFFRNSTLLSISAMLTKLQNSIKLIENKTISYCHNQIGQTDGDGFFDSFSAIAALSSSYVKAGERIEITAGMGSFSTQARPVITVNHKNVPLMENGLAVYSFKASNKPGKHFVSLRIDFYDQEGNKQYVRKQLEYTVAKPCDQ